MKHYRFIQNATDILRTSYDFNISDCFNAIDCEQLGYLDYDSINLFMHSQSAPITVNEIEAFIGFVGSGDTGRISFAQFNRLFSAT